MTQSHIRPDNGRDLGQIRIGRPSPRTEERHASPFRVGQTHATSAQVCSQDPVLGSEVLDHSLLLARDPADGRRQRQM